MAVSWPFDATVTDDTEGNPIYSRTYSADVLARILQKYFSNGVFNDVSTNLQVVENSKMTVTVHPGDALINGRHFYEESDRVLAVTAANATLDRIDTVVLRLNLAVEALTIDLYVVAGTPAATPTSPSLTRNASIYELGIANLFITKNTTTISQAKITDTRLDNARCGVVASIIGDTDTSTYYAQIQADLDAFKTGRETDFDVWFATVQNTLGEDAAGNLLNLINARVTITSIINALTSDDTAVPLAAAQGKALKALVDAAVKKAAFQTGDVTITVPAGTHVGQSVTFPTAFAKAPIVVAWTTYGTPERVACSTGIPTTTAVTLIAGNLYTASINVTIRWLAINPNA